MGHLHFEMFDRFGRHGEDPHLWAVNELAPDFGREHKTFMKKWHHWGSVVGKVTRAQKFWNGELDPSGREIHQPYHPEIMKRAQQVRETARNVLVNMGATKISDISKPLRAQGGGATVASCRAGSDPKESVVNSDFECHDVDNLFLCDASVVPGVPSAHNGGTGTAYMACYAWRRIVAKHFSR